MPSCVAVAPGSTFTSARPSRKRGLEIHCRRSWNSVCMIPMIAGPPYAVAPILRKPSPISFQVLANDSVMERYLRAAPGGARLLVDGDRGGDVLKGDAAALEHRDLVVARRSGRRPTPTSASFACTCHFSVATGSADFGRTQFYRTTDRFPC